MAPLTLEGDTLGQRHRYYNQLVQKAISSQKIELTEINFNDTDIENLFKIDTACKTKNVEYIIDVLKCSDMLYVSRAVKQSTWLINDTQYAHIIEPQYLFTQLFPHMNTKAVNKLLLHIRLHLKDTKRVETFYEYLKDKTEISYKWLQNCSDDFIESVLTNGCYLPESIYKRLCKRAFKFAKYHTNVSNASYPLEHVSFLVKKHTEEYFDLTEKVIYCQPSYNKKCTKKIMEKCPNKILDDFDRYYDHVDLSVVAKHIEKENMKEFLIKQTKNKKLNYFFNDHNKIKHFIKSLPKRDRLHFVRSIFIDKTEVEMESDYQHHSCAMKCSNDAPSSENNYQMYQYLPFDVAFTELKKAIRLESSPTERNSILAILITCAKKNLTHIQTLLQFYHDNHINEPFNFKVQFIDNLLTQTPIHKLDAESWHTLNHLFHSMEVYTESKNNVQICFKYIVMYHVLHNEKIPEIVEKKFKLDTLKNIQSKLNDDEKAKLFAYLWSRMIIEIQNIETTDSEKFDAALLTLKNSFNLLNDWNKSLIDYPILINTLKELLKIKKDQGLGTDFSPLYGVNDSWRKDLFEFSLVLHPSEEACLNALKHGPRLLAEHNEQVAALQVDNSVSLRRLLTKLRIYWPHSMAQQWTEAYLNKLDNTSELRPVIKGLFTLLPLSKILDIAKKHMPADSEIKWSETDPLDIGLRKNIAKSLHLARPNAPLDSVLWYAKGDYLQYAVPTLNAITQNFSKVQCSELISVLLDVPVQKCGLHVGFKKLNFDEQREILSYIWKTNKKSSIRCILFTRTHKLLCDSRDAENCKKMWNLLSMFVDSLNSDENEDIYKTLSDVPSLKEIPSSIRGEYFMKAYLFFTSLPAKSNCQNFIYILINNAPEVTAFLCPDFVVNKLLAPVNELLKQSNYDLLAITSAYILCCQTQEEQLEKYKAVLAPAICNALQSWNAVQRNQYYVKDNLNKLIQQLSYDFRKVILLKKGKVLPTKVFEALKSDIEQNLPIEKNYILYTCWKLTTEYVKLADEHKYILNNPKLDYLKKYDLMYQWMPDDADAAWQDLHFKLSPALASIIVKYLKEDVNTYFPSIYTMFQSAVAKMFDNLELHSRLLIIETLKYMLSYEDFIPCCLIVCNLTPKYGSRSEVPGTMEIRKRLASHPSKEVRIHYNRAFGNSIEQEE